MIEHLVDVGLQSIVISGTCYEYGLVNGPLKEDQLTDPQNSYSIAKDCLRRLIAQRYARKQLRWCWARIFADMVLAKTQILFCRLCSLLLKKVTLNF